MIFASGYGTPAESSSEGMSVSEVWNSRPPEAKPPAVTPVFTMKDLRISTKIDDPCIMYRNLDKTPEVIYYVCLTTIVLSVLTKAIQIKKITHKRYKSIAGNYLRESFMGDIIREQERRKDDPNFKKPTVSRTLVKSENEKVHPSPKPAAKKKPSSKTTKGHRPWVHIIYTPMGNKR